MPTRIVKKIASRTLLLALGFTLLLPLASCGRRYAKGEYIPADQIILRSDKFVESDLQIIAKKLSESLMDDPVVTSWEQNKEKPTVLMSLMINDTDEHIDMKSLSDKIRTHLFKSRTMNFINGPLRPTVKEEVEYSESDWVDPRTAKRKGKQWGADYLISGTITSIKQPVGRQEIVYYKVTLEMTNLETNVLAWTDDLEIKKKFRKRFTGS